MNDSPCDECPLDPSRRAFLQLANVAAIGALMMVGIPAELAAAIRPELLTSARRVGADPSYPIPAKDGVQIDKKDQVILVRWKNDVYAFNLSCPHQNTALRWNDDAAEFQCPKHHSKYKPDGTFISGRATRNMDRFSVTRSGADIIVHVDRMHKNDAESAGWTASVIQLAAGA